MPLYLCSNMLLHIHLALPFNLKLTIHSQYNQTNKLPQPIPMPIPAGGGGTVNIRGLTHWTHELYGNSKGISVNVRFPSLVDWMPIRLHSSISGFLSKPISSFVKNHWFSQTLLTIYSAKWKFYLEHITFGHRIEFSHQELGGLHQNAPSTSTYYQYGFFRRYSRLCLGIGREWNGDMKCRKRLQSCHSSSKLSSTPQKRLRAGPRLGVLNHNRCGNRT